MFKTLTREFFFVAWHRTTVAEIEYSLRGPGSMTSNCQVCIRFKFVDAAFAFSSDEARNRVYMSNLSAADDDARARAVENCEASVP